MRLKPAVSVITPSYNCERFIDRVVASVDEQSELVHEHIIIDDGSDDGTLERLQELEKKYVKLKVISQENKGAGAARNAGIEEAGGRYIAFLDSDDVWLPGKLEAQVTFMESEQAPFTYGDYTEVDSRTGEVVAKCEPPDSLSYYDLLGGCSIGCLTAAYNQEVLGKRYMPLVRRGQDWGLWLAIARSGVLARKYPGDYALYNVVNNSLSKNKFKKLFDIYEIYREEEGLSGLTSLKHLFRHFQHVREKRNKV